MALTDINSVKTQLGISGSDEDAKLTQFISQAEALILSEIKRPIEAADYTEFYDGTGTETLVLRIRPVVSVASVHLDPTGYYGDGPDAFAATTALTVGEDFVLCRDDASVATGSISGRIIRVGGVWPGRSTHRRGDVSFGKTAGLGNIKVVYRAGYETVPADIQLAANNVVALMRRAAKRGKQIKSERVDYYSYTLADDHEAMRDITSVTSTLAKYKKWAI